MVALLLIFYQSSIAMQNSIHQYTYFIDIESHISYFEEAPSISCKKVAFCHYMCVRA